MTRQPVHGQAAAPAWSIDPAHAPGKRGKGPAPTVTHMPKPIHAKGLHDQPWVPTSGLIGRQRRSARRS